MQQHEFAKYFQIWKCLDLAPKTRNNGKATRKVKDR